MPYVKQEARDLLNTGIPPSTPGELNYLITELALAYWYDNGERYQQINDILGALEGAKLEFYRRVAVPYEEEKIKANGDIY